MDPKANTHTCESCGGDLPIMSDNLNTRRVSCPCGANYEILGASDAIMGHDYTVHRIPG